MNSVNLVSGELNPDLIIFDATPQKNELFLLNCFKLKKKREVVKPISTKYCSRGAHLGRSTAFYMQTSQPRTIWSQYATS